MKLLLDSDAMIALSKSDDSNHKKILKFFRAEREIQVYVSHLCIAEVCKVLSLRISHESAKAFLENIRERNIIELGYSIPLRQAADNVFLTQESKGTSWVDCFNVAIMKIENLDGLVSFDKFYKKFDFKV